MRVLLVTGKGGVGKTTVAAATACRCAELGYSTVVISTDPAHSLGDAFERELGADAELIAENLWVHEVSALHEMERNWHKLHGYISRLFATQGLEQIVAEEVATPPGMDEVAALMWIKRYAEMGRYEVMVVDCAPTGETLQLLMFPEAARWWIDKVYPWERRAMRLARPLLQPLLDGQLPTEEIFGAVNALLSDIDAVKDLLINPDVTSIRLVLNLEKMVVKEAKRAYTYLSLFGYQTDAVVVNRSLPETLQDPLFQGWQQLQRGYAEEVQNSFSPLPILNAPLFAEEVVGIERLRKLAEVVYGDQDPSLQLYTGKQQRVEQVGDECILVLSMPLVSKEEVQIDRSGGELSLTVGNYRREVTLPRTLAARETLGASLEEGELRVRFGEMVRV